MIRLLRVEVTRLICRRAVWVLLVAALVIPAAIAVGVVIDTQPPSGSELAAAQAQVDQESQTKGVQRQLQRCVEKPEKFLGEPVPENVREACEESFVPQVEWYVWFNKLDLVNQRDEGSGLAVAIVLAVLMLLAGTTFAGHDWASGSVSNQLLFEPRRMRVWLAKALVVTATTALVTAVVMTLYWLLLAAIARGRDYEVPGGVLMDCFQMGWRAAGVAGFAALCGFALTMLFRSTVAALGVLLAVSVAGGVVLAVIGVDSIWNPGLNLGAVILDGMRYGVDGPCPADSGAMPGETCWIEKTLGFGRAATFLGSAGLAMVVASMVSFQRRDVP